MKRKFTGISSLCVCLLLLLLAVSACGNKSTVLTEDESAAITAIAGVDSNAFVDISAEALSPERQKKFPAIDKVYQADNFYAFITSPIAYNGPITLALVIDNNTKQSVGMQIVNHVETDHYVRDMGNNWFTSRFADKNALEYLELARLTARADNEIVSITGATVTTEGIVNGVNAAFGVYQEHVLAQNAADIPYMVRFEPGEGDGPVETESLAIRAYGVVLGEINLEDIKTLPSVKRTMSIHSSTGVTQHAFRGTLLSNVLNLLDPNLVEEYDWVLAVGVDDYISDIAMEEVQAENNVYIMYEDNDQPLLKKTGAPGALRVVVLDDTFGQRFTNYMLEVVLEKEEPY